MRFRTLFEPSVVVAVLMTALYAVTRSPLAASDGSTWFHLVEQGRAFDIEYGSSVHFLQIPLLHALYRLLGWIGLSASGSAVFLAFNLICALAGALGFSALAARLAASSDRPVWKAFAVFLFLASFGPWFYWNGELHVFPSACAILAVLAALKDRFFLGVFFWAIAVLARGEYALLAPAISVAGFFGARDHGRAHREAFLRIALFTITAGVITVVVLLSAGYLVGKWHDAETLREWLFASYQVRARYLGGMHPVSAAKGLLGTITVGTHFVGDFAKGTRAPGLALHAALGTLVLGGVLFFLSRLRWKASARILFIGLAWLVPFQLLFNGRMLPGAEEYHASSFPALALLLFAGLHEVAARGARGRVVAGAFVVFLFALNFFAGMVPVRSYARDVMAAADRVRELSEPGAAGSAATGAAFLSCDDEEALRKAGADFLRAKDPLIRAGRTPTPLEAFRAEIRQWAEPRLRAGRTIYVVGDACDTRLWNEELARDGHPHLPPDVFEVRFAEIFPGSQLNPVDGVSVPLNWTVQPDRFSWKYARLYRVLLPDSH